jgi:hypothetical protein
MGRRRRDGNHIPQKNNSIEDLVGNEENGYPIPDPNNTMIHVTNENYKPLKKEIKEGCRRWKDLQNAHELAEST